jgi:hypothetical protein
MKKIIKKMQKGGTAKKTKVDNIGGPSSPSKGMLYNDAYQVARSKYYTPDNIRKSSNRNVTDLAADVEIGIIAEDIYKKYLKNNNMSPSSSKKKSTNAYDKAISTIKKKTGMKKGGTVKNSIKKK